MTDRIVAEPTGQARRHDNAHPTEPHGWFACQVTLEDGFEFSVELWWNQNSIAGGWWVGTPGRCRALSEAWPGARVLKVCRERLGVSAERAACAALVREMARIEGGVGATWEREAELAAPGADKAHLRACAAIGHSFAGFADRLEDLAAAIEARKP
jgi:hypothetical protein